MFELSRLEKLKNELQDIFKLPSITLRQHKVTELKIKFDKELDFFFSLSLEVKEKFTLNTKLNGVNYLDFNKTMGEILYIYLNSDNIRYDLNKYIYKIPYSLQILLFYVFNNSFSTKLTELYLLEHVNTYYKLSDMASMLYLPTIISSINAPIQSLQREEIGDIKFPVRVFKNFSKFKVVSLNYFVKKDGKFISNINIGSIREELNNIIGLQNYGGIGVIVKEKPFKRKFKFILLYLNSNSDNVIGLYKKQSEFNNELEQYKHFFALSDKIELRKLELLETESDFKNYLKKTKSKFVLFTQNQVDFSKPIIKYDYAKIVDYMYDDNFDVIGLIINYQDNKYELKFKVENTNYIYDIQNKFVRISLLYYNNIVVNIWYNSEVKQWSNKYTHCVLCKSIRNKHTFKGICQKCYSKLYNKTLYIDGKYNESCTGEDLETIINNCKVTVNNGKLMIEPLSGKQLSFDFYKETVCGKD